MTTTSATTATTTTKLLVLQTVPVSWPASKCSRRWLRKSRCHWTHWRRRSSWDAKPACVCYVAQCEADRPTHAAHLPPQLDMLSAVWMTYAPVYNAVSCYDGH